MTELEPLNCSCEVDIERFLSSGIAPNLYHILNDTVMSSMFMHLKNQFAHQLQTMILNKKFGPFNTDNYHGRLTVVAKCMWEPINKTPVYKKEEKND